MEKGTIPRDGLHKIPHDLLVDMFLQLNSPLAMMQEQNETLIKQISDLQENIAILTQQRFGRKTEELSEIPGQLSLTFDPANAINEAGAITDGGIPEEPEMETVIVRRRSKTKGKREADLSGMETIIDPTVTIPEERLLESSPKGYHRLPDDVYTDLGYQPARFVVHEHHIAVYAGNGDTGVVRADKPERLLKNSILTPSLAAAIFEEKYVNHVHTTALRPASNAGMPTSRGKTWQDG